MNPVAVLGLGLIGGSLARDLHECGVEVAGFDQSGAVLSAARASGVISTVLGPDLEGLEEFETVVLGVPVDVAPQLLQLASARLDNARLITDVGSTKRTICAEAEALGLGRCFVGAHPFAGDHRSGWRASRTGLFRGARVFLCPVAQTTDSAIDLAHQLWQSMGAGTEIITAEAHDQRIAWTSQLPQLSSSALALALADAKLPVTELGRGGLDATRLAGSDPALWTGIVLDNTEHVTRALAAFERCIAELRREIETHAEDQIRNSLQRAQEWTLGTARDQGEGEGEGKDEV